MVSETDGTSLHARQLLLQHLAHALGSRQLLSELLLAELTRLERLRNLELQCLKLLLGFAQILANHERLGLGQLRDDARLLSVKLGLRRGALLGLGVPSEAEDHRGKNGDDRQHQRPEQPEERHPACVLIFGLGQDHELFGELLGCRTFFRIHREPSLEMWLEEIEIVGPRRIGRVLGSLLDEMLDGARRDHLL